MTLPCNPLAAATHHDPYPYYAALLRNGPLHWDDTLGMWIATSAEAVTAVLEHRSCYVRPTDEPVPATLQGTPVGHVFGNLVRMTDGASHCPLKQAVSMTLTSLERDKTAELAGTCATLLRQKFAPLDRAGLTEFTLSLPEYTVAALLGFSSDHWPAVAKWTGDLARCIAPGAAPEQLERGQHAARELQAVAMETLAAANAGPTSLMAELASQTKALGINSDAVISANAIGFLLQAYDATAGLIGNAMVALGRDTRLLTQVIAEPQHLRSVIQEVLRHDPPIQNTRRFVSQDDVIVGQPVRAGDTILVVLAAANRDPTRFTAPERFDPSRQPQHCFTFGQGRHACPGEALALDIAEAGVAQLLHSGKSLPALTGTVAYRESLNARIPLFTATAVASSHPA